MSHPVVKVVNKVLIYLFFLVSVFFTLYPLVYVISASFSPGTGIASLNILPFADGFTTEHFEHLFKNTDYPRWFRNTFIVATSTSLLTTLFVSLGAYAISRFKFSFRKPLLMSMLILQIFPSFVGMVAIYVILLRIGGIDQLWGLVLIYVAGNLPYNTWLVKGYLDQVSKNLDEAAIIDGASNLRVFVQIILPIIKPILIFLAIASFTGPWMDFIFPTMVLRSPEKQTLAIGLFNFVTDKKNEFTNFAAGSVLIAIPFVFFFVITQKMLIESLSGAVKE